MIRLVLTMLALTVVLSPVVHGKGQEIYQKDKPVKEKVESKRGHVKEGRG